MGLLLNSIKLNGPVWLLHFSEFSTKRRKRLSVPIRFMMQILLLYWKSIGDHCKCVPLGPITAFQMHQIFFGQKQTVSKYRAYIFHPNQSGFSSFNIMHHRHTVKRRLPYPLFLPDELKTCTFLTLLLTLWRLLLLTISLFTDYSFYDSNN